MARSNGCRTRWVFTACCLHRRCRAEAIKALKSDQSREIHPIGGLMLARTLLEQNLVDVLRLMIDPIHLGAAGSGSSPTTTGPHGGNS